MHVAPLEEFQRSNQVAFLTTQEKVSISGETRTRRDTFVSSILTETTIPTRTNPARRGSL